MALACTLMASGWVAAPGAAPGLRLRTADRNHDGRPDEWRYYDADNREVRVELDRNFDGAADEIDSFRNGRLIGRQLDRNFDHRIDLVETFDGERDPVRTVVDVDFDGTADLLVLFRDGRPVVTRYSNAPRGHAVTAGQVTVARATLQTASGGLHALRDVFLGERAWMPPAGTMPCQLVAETLPVVAIVGPHGRLTPVAVARARQPRPRGPTLTPIFSTPFRGPPLSLHRI